VASTNHTDNYSVRLDVICDDNNRRLDGLDGPISSSSLVQKMKSMAAENLR
jgi:hypothetical protein